MKSHQRQSHTNAGVREEKRRRGHQEGGSLQTPGRTARRRCVGRGSRVGREPAQQGGFLPGQAFPQAGRPSLLPGPPPRPVRALALRLSGARRSPRASPPASGHSLRPCSRLSPSNHSSATAPWLSHPPERGEAPRGGAGGAAISGGSDLLLAVASRPELHILRAPFSFRAESEVCFGQGLLTSGLFSVPSYNPSPSFFPFRVFRALRRQV